MSADSSTPKIPEAIRLVIYGRGDVVAFDRLYIEPPTIPQLHEIRSVAKAALALSQKDDE